MIMNHLKFQKVQLAVAVGLLMLATPSVVNAEEVSACRSLSKRDTVVIIAANDGQRVESIKQIVQQRSLTGEFCQNRFGRTVWMSNQLGDRGLAVQIFNYFREAGLVKPVQLRQPV
jgi:hypothetical protein